MTQLQSQLKKLLDEVLGQVSSLRKGGAQALYYCKCGHYKKKLEVKLDPPFLAHCWVCDYATNIYGLLKKYKASKSYYDQVSKLTGNIKRNYTFSKINRTKELVLPKEFIPLSIDNSTCVEYRNAMAYLKSRGVTLIDIIRHNIGYCKSGDYENNIIFPSYDLDGKLNFFIGRQYYDTPGIIPYKKPDISMNIVGFESLISYKENINIVEGCFDALSVRNNAIPLFGKNISGKLQEKLITNKVKRVNMILDNDALHDAIENCKLMIRLGIEIYLVRLSGKDPSELGFEEIHELIRNAKPLEFDDLLAYELRMSTTPTLKG